MVFLHLDHKYCPGSILIGLLDCRDSSLKRRNLLRQSAGKQVSFFFAVRFFNDLKFFDFSRQIKSLFIFTVLTSFLILKLNSEFLKPEFQSFTSNQKFVYFPRFDEIFH